MLPGRIERYRRNSVRLIPTPAELSIIPLGGNRIGGCPDVPKDFEWPRFENHPLSFIAQLNLADIAHYELGLDLPICGSLLFFYDSQQRTWGFAPRDKGSAVVLYSSCDTDQLRRVPLPPEIDKMGVFNGCSLAFKPDTNYPSYDSIFFNPELSEDEMNRLFAYQEQQRANDFGPFHRIGGHADCVQNPMELECALVTNGLYCGDASGYSDPMRKELEYDAENWRLLLQIDSDDHAGMMWGDVGMIYYWIHTSDLVNHRFDRSWLILQCC